MPRPIHIGNPSSKVRKKPDAFDARTFLLQQKGFPIAIQGKENREELVRLGAKPILLYAFVFGDHGNVVKAEKWE